MSVSVPKFAIEMKLTLTVKTTYCQQLLYVSLKFFTSMM